jgi:two-component system, OmpR family, response regulator
MTHIKKTTIFLVDDDTVFLRLLAITFAQATDYVIETYPTGELCLQHLDRAPDIIVLDYHLDGIDSTAMNGIDTLDAIKKMHPDLPVIMLSSQDKIEVAVRCMHHKAYDYVVKSETAFMRLQNTITMITQQQKTEKMLHWYMQKM